MKRYFFTFPNKCRNACKYCFEDFNSCAFPIITYDAIKDLKNSIIYPCCNTELYINNSFIDFFTEYINKGTYSNIFSFSTKNNIGSNEITILKQLNEELKKKGIGEIKISISITNKYKINELEPNTALYDERLSLAEVLLQNNIKTSVIIKPILPFIEITEYQEIIDDFINYGVLNFVMGNLYINRNTPFYKEYIKDKYKTSLKNILWIEDTPQWEQVEDTMYNIIRSYATLKNAFIFDSDEQLISYLFK